MRANRQWVSMRPNRQRLCDRLLTAAHLQADLSRPLLTSRTLDAGSENVVNQQSLRQRNPWQNSKTDDGRPGRKYEICFEIDPKITRDMPFCPSRMAEMKETFHGAKSGVETHHASWISCGSRAVIARGFTRRQGPKRQFDGLGRKLRLSQRRQGQPTLGKGSTRGLSTPGHTSLAHFQPCDAKTGHYNDTMRTRHEMTHT